ncbi:MAG: hypothetical protein AAF654_12445 [Myxococcota bacterium]
MKLRAVAVSLAISACSQQAEPVTDDEKVPAVTEEVAREPTPDAAVVKETTAGSDPVQACEALVEAAKAGDAEAFVEHSTETAVEAMAKSEEAAKSVMSTIGQAVCGEATVTGESATVSVAVGDTTRDLPFALSAAAWKFDAAGYIDKYPPQASEAPKAAKGKKGRKKRRKKRKG